VDEPLAQWRQYKKNLNRTVLVTLQDDTEKLGVLKDVDDERIVLETKVPKKKETLTIEIPVTDIKKTVVQIIF
jgi:ribosome maturation factor RimP